MNGRTASILVRLAAALFLLRAPALAAQVVRGTVTERPADVAVPGVLVSLEREDSAGRFSIVRSVLSNEKGEYAVRAPDAGRYRITAKRIGVARFESDPFDVASGETRRLDVELEKALFTLPEVRVTSTTMCISRPSQAERVFALWDEVQTALTATRISLRDSLFSGRVTRYVRQLDPRSLKVLSESRSLMAGEISKPHSAVSADSLSKVGYWWPVPGEDAQIFNGPDADILTSPSFMHDHCFEAVEGAKTRRGLVGLAFEPRPERRVGDIRGTLWLDARSFELQLVEFHYTRLEVRDSSNIGGEVHFARLPNGAWIVRRWFLRVPQFAHAGGGPVTTTTRVPMLLIRPTVYQLIEDGGDVFAEGLRLFTKPAVILGTVSDSAGRPDSGATVHLDGMPFSTRTDSAGRFRLDSLPAGRLTLVADDAGYASLGVPFDTRALTVEEGDTVRVALRGAKSEVVLSGVCGRKSVAAKQGALRLTLVDQTTGAPLDALGIWLRWRLRADKAGTHYDGVEARSDGRGVAVFCGVPATVPLELFEVEADGRVGAHLVDLTLGEREVAARTIRLRRQDRGRDFE